MTIFHMQPSATLDWEGEFQVDDRPGMLFKGHGGILDHIDVQLGTDQGATTDGAYFVRVYRATVDGDGLDPVPSEWQASTAYSVGDLVRATGTANADSHFVYRCTSAGTSDSTEPTWPQTSSGAGNSWSEVADEGDTINDNTVIWEVVYVGSIMSFSLPDDTPTPGWIAESDHVAYAPGTNESPSWKTLDFTGADRVRLQDGEWYCVVVQWNANSSDTNNLIVVEGSITTDADHEGVCYLDGSSGVNNGPRVFEDLYFRLYESKTTLDKVSGTDAGFENLTTPADTDPFNEGEAAAYTVQAGEALDDGTYWWKVRAVDPNGGGVYSSFTSTRTFTVTTGFLAFASDGIAFGDTPVESAALTATAVDGIDLGDTPVNTAALLAAALDGVDFGDASQVLLLVSALAADGIVLSDSSTVLAALLALGADGIDLGDAAPVIASLAALAEDGAAFGDAVNVIAALQALSQDGVDFGEAALGVVSGAGIIPAIATDGISLGDTSSVTAALLALAADGVDLGDTVLALAALRSISTDGVTFSDNASGVLLAQLIAATATDGISFGDTALVQANYTVTAVDGISLGDAVAGVLSLVALAQDGLEFADLAREVSTLPSGLASVDFGSAQVGIEWDGKIATITWATKYAIITFNVRG